MNKLYLFLFSILLVTVYCSINSFACSTVTFPRVKFNPKEFMFVGEVVGFSNKMLSKKVRGDIYAVRVKVLEEIYLYKEPKDYFEIIQISEDGDCSRVGIELEDLKKDFPIGSKVKVIAVEDNFVSGKNKNSRIILQNDRSNAIFIESPERKSNISATSFFNYSKWKNFSGWEVNFELQKDLFRLSKAKKEEEKLKVLDRLIYYDEFIPQIPIFSINFELIAKTYLKDSPQLKNLLEKRKEIELKSAKY